MIVNVLFSLCSFSDATFDILCSNPDDDPPTITAAESIATNDPTENSYVNIGNARRVEVTLRRIIVSKKVDVCCELIPIPAAILKASERNLLMVSFLPVLLDLWQHVSANFAAALSHVENAKMLQLDETLLKVALSFRGLACAHRIVTGEEPSHSQHLLVNLTADLDAGVLALVRNRKSESLIINYFVKNLLSSLLMVQLIQFSISGDDSRIELVCDVSQQSQISILAIARAIKCAYFCDAHVSSTNIDDFV